MTGKKTVVVIGGGAAGYFAAINLAQRSPDTGIFILEKSLKLLSKVRISGGGRCNVTNNCPETELLIKNYPRGSRELRQVFSRFSVNDTIDWFKRQGVKLKTEPDGRMFPETDSSETIIACLTGGASDYRVQVRTSCEVRSIRPLNGQFAVSSGCGDFLADAVICAMGGHPKAGSYQLMKQTGHTIVDPVPSLFTFNMPAEKIRTQLQGLSVQNARVQVEGTKLRQEGPLLITHWGMSGPAVLKISAFGAIELHKKNYHATLVVNWGGLSPDETAESLKTLQQQRRLAAPHNTPHFGLPARLWEFLCDAAGIQRGVQWAGLSKKHFLSLAALICGSRYRIEGKTTFREEFVTCGGIDLREVDFRTMESRIVPGLYFCGEVLNIDGITGGFNFQAAWSTAWLCAKSVHERLK